MTGRSLTIGEEKLAVSFTAADDIPAAAAGLCAEGATVLAFPAVHAALAGGSARKERQALKAARSGGLCVCVSGGYNESSTDWVTDGLALIASPDGRLARGRPFAFEAALCPEGLRPRVFSELDERPDPIHPYAPPAGPQRAAWCREAVEICAHALRLRMERAGAATALIGLSGGLDSAMALVTACRAFDMMGRDKSRGILAYALPGFGSGERTRGNARRLSEALGVPLEEIDIRAAVSRHLEDISHDGRNDAAYENAQARERTQILMDLANMHGGLMLGPGDLSELALGFTTYGGDHLSMYCLNSGLYKSAIRLILKQLAEDSKGLPLEVALLSILDTPVSPELLPAEQGEISQKTEDIVGPYELNDFYLHHFLQGRSSPETLFSLAISAFGEKYGGKELLARMESLFRRFFAAQFKRSCLPDGPMVLGVSLSPRGGWQMPSDASAALWLKEVDRLRKIYAAGANA
jgi:NAD+ synthase (glutamine-hydrolysing)